LLAEPINDARFSKIVRRHLKLDPISRGKADESFPHFSRDVGEDEMLISKLNAEHGSREHGDNLSFGYNRTFGRHSELEALVYWLTDFSASVHRIPMKRQIDW
jgi:hypothetical protein